MQKVKEKIQNIVKPSLNAVKQLLCYLYYGLIPMIPATIKWLFDEASGFQKLLRIDVGVCIFAHGMARTISGLTGELAKTERRYYYQAKAIDVLAYPFEKKWHHCERVNRVEQINLIRHGKYIVNL